MSASRLLDPKGLTLARSRATRLGFGFQDLFSNPPDPALVQRVPLEYMVRDRWVPVVAEENRVVVASVHLPTPDVITKVQFLLDVEHVEWRLTAFRDIDQTLQQMFRRELSEYSTLGLYRIDPAACAYSVLTRPQFLVITALVTLFVGSMVQWPLHTLTTMIVVLNLGFTGSILFKLMIALTGAAQEEREMVTDEEVAALTDDELPIYTVLVPAYKEANIVGLLLENMRALEYPSSKLEILLLLEEDDVETIEAAKAALPPETVTILTIPDIPPKTKPKACNVGLQFARGEYVVIYDAEDRPERDQLKRAYIAFQKSGDDTVCIQAALNYFNHDENFLTRMFTLEYSFWFDYILPGLDRLGLPIPLGGTSNHFRTHALRELGGWDPFNVTEDADLGIRASAKGYRVGVVNSTTYEEANTEYWNWIRQRSRWIKGYMQTTLVHLRRPLSLVRVAGWRQSLSFLLLIGGTPFAFLAAPPMLALTTIDVITGAGWIDDATPDQIIPFAYLNFALGSAFMIYLNVLAVFRRGRYELVPFALCNPIYWTLHMIASYKALVQLITKPFYWEKTTHGLSEHLERNVEHELADRRTDI